MSRTATTSPILVLLLACCLLVAGPAARAQEEPEVPPATPQTPQPVTPPEAPSPEEPDEEASEEEEEPPPDDDAPPLETQPVGGTASVILEGRPLTTTPFLLTAGGPVFDLRTMASVLGGEVSVGPLGVSHRLTVKDREVLVGPDQNVAVVSTAGRRQEILNFSQRPVRGSQGLMVPIEVLRMAVDPDTGPEIVWDPVRVVLEVRRRQTRALRISVDLFHQHTSTVELRFSEAPRYEVKRFPGVLEIRLIGDRLLLPVDVSRATSPLVRRVFVASDRIRVELMDDAGAAEPRLIESPEPRIVVEAFQQTTVDDEPRREKTPRVVAPGIRTIVIDPGHGGPESGAVGPTGITEKELALAVSRSLKRLLQRRMAVRVILTRDDDEDLSLEMRTAIANQNQADLFISLHFNSYFGRTAHGAETYFLSREASDQVAAAAAAAENRMSGVSDPEMDLQLILWDLAQTYHLAESQRFANLVQEELNEALGLRDRGVKQAPFRVLMGAAMPAVLVELGFLSNPEEEAKLKSPEYQAELVDSLFRAIRRFKTQVEAEAARTAAAAREPADSPSGQDPPP